MTEKDRNIFLQTLYACLHTICGYLIIPISESNKVDLIKGHKWIKYYQYRPDTQKLYLQINVNKVSAKYSCGFSNLLDSSIIVNER